MSLLMVLAAGIELQLNGAALTPGQARAMGPGALAGALLAPGHPPIVEAVVGQEGMRPPPPPGSPVATEIKLFSAAVPSNQPGFCEKTVAIITLAPVMPVDGQLPPAKASMVTTKQYYRWWANPQQLSSCEGPRYSYFAPEDHQAERFLSVVRLLAIAQRRSREGSHLEFTVSIDDPFGRDLQDEARRNPDQVFQPIPEEMKLITDGRAGLTAFPIASITMIANSSAKADNRLSTADLTDESGNQLQGVTLFAGGMWTADVILNGDRIVRVRLRRAIPPPF